MCIVKECDKEGTENFELSVGDAKQLIKLCPECVTLLQGGGSPLSISCKNSKSIETDMIFQACT